MSAWAAKWRLLRLGYSREAAATFIPTAEPLDWPAPTTMDDIAIDYRDCRRWSSKRLYISRAQSLAGLPLGVLVVGDMFLRLGGSWPCGGILIGIVRVRVSVFFLKSRRRLLVPRWKRLGGGFRWPGIWRGGTRAWCGKFTAGATMEIGIGVTRAVDMLWNPRDKRSSNTSEKRMVEQICIFSLVVSP